MKIKQILKYIKSDLYRYSGEITIKNLIRSWIFQRGFRFSFWFRCCETNSLIFRVVAKLFRYRVSRKYGIDIPAHTKIGYGLYIGHGIGIVVNPTTVIGNNCNLSQFLTIGSNQNQAAHIHDNVYIGPSVSIVDRVTIGSDSSIGAGSVVIDDVSANCTVAGVPAKVISTNGSAQYIANKWLDLD